MKKMYFVESVKHFENRTTALLLYIPNNISDWENENRDFKWFVRTEVNVRHAEIIREGAYVYSIGHNGYITASEDERVMRINERSDRLLNILRQRLQNEPIFSYKNINKLYSYHINVGHGNHSLIVFNANNKFHIWMVDCSDYDFVLHHYYRKNIDECLNHIKIKFGLPSINIEAVMLTHPHYDHYSGIGYYIDNGMIAKESKFYINLKHNIKSHNFNNLLTKIAILGSPIIEPFSCNSCVNIQILYPDKLTFTNHNLSLNNTSSVYNIGFDDVSYFVFPGDLETKGWNLMNTNVCLPYMRNTRYYAISHHGSLNGHLRNFTCNQRGQRINSIKDCLSQKTIPILMGRNHAFSEIYSQDVINDFSDRILLYSEKDPANNKVRFLEIDLLSSTKIWY